MRRRARGRRSRRPQPGLPQENARRLRARGEGGDGQRLDRSSVVDTVYDACACTPIGKLKKVSQAVCAGGGTRVIGRRTRTTAWGGRRRWWRPTVASTTTYLYQGNTVTVTDPAGKWKKMTHGRVRADRAGERAEPGDGAGLCDHATTYDVMDHLVRAEPAAADRRVARTRRCGRGRTIRHDQRLAIADPAGDGDDRVLRTIRSGC